MPRKDLNDAPIARFGKFLGINNVDDKGLIGPRFLPKAIDFDNHQDGRLILRAGQTLIEAGTTKQDMWNDITKTIVLYMDNGTLKRLNKDETSTIIASGFSPNRIMNFCDGDGRIWCTNEETIGYIQNDVYYDTFTDPLDFYKVRPMPGNDIDYGHGRLWVTRGDKVWYSDGHRPTQFDLTQNFMPFAGKVSLFRCVTQGIWVCDGKIWFLAGTNPKVEMRPVLKADYDVIPRTDKMPAGDRVGPEGTPDVPVFFLSTHGACLAGVDGGFKNLTDRKYKANISLNGVRYGTSIIMHTNGISRYITTIKY